MLQLNLDILGTFAGEDRQIAVKPRVPRDSNRFLAAPLEAWILSFPRSAQALLRRLTAKINHISHNNFVDALRLSYQKLPKGIAERSICLVEPGKSQKWVAELLVENEGFSPAAFLRLGEEGANMLDFSIKDFLGAKVPMDKPFQHIVIADDGSFSGNQMANNISAAMRIFKKYAPEYQPHFHVILPFATAAAIKKIEGMAEERGIKVHIYNAEVIPTIDEIFKKANEKKVLAKALLGTEDNANNFERMGLTYFDHNVPNKMSFPERMAEGIPGDADKENIPFIPASPPPYKSEDRQG